jgi:flagellar biosynthesis chaperone FliJ
VDEQIRIGTLELAELNAVLAEYAANPIPVVEAEPEAEVEEEEWSLENDPEIIALRALVEKAAQEERDAERLVEAVQARAARAAFQMETLGFRRSAASQATEALKKTEEMRQELAADTRLGVAAARADELEGFIHQFEEAEARVAESEAALLAAMEPYAVAIAERLGVDKQLAIQGIIESLEAEPALVDPLPPIVLEAESASG